MQFVLQKSVPRRADRTVATVMARFFGHYDKDGIDAVNDWVTTIAASTFGANAKPGQPATTQVISVRSDSRVSSEPRLAQDARQRSQSGRKQISQSCRAKARAPSLSRGKSWDRLSEFHRTLIRAIPQSRNRLEIILQATAKEIDGLASVYRAKGIAQYIRNATKEVVRTKSAVIVKDAKEEMICAARELQS
ncbi:hypothetical protein Slin14017_G042050 [Septoria linicola]|nr:hypothetical protein Slin14017_G042050 [Septoria linicola]